jgi:hypothetical protein
MSTIIKVYPFTNNFLFPDYKNVIRFQSEAHRVAFFSSNGVGGTNFSASGGTSAYQSINFNWNDGYETTIRITNTDNSSVSSSTNFLAFNYLHVVETIGELQPIQYFYFIVGAKFINVDIIEYRVVLDVFTTHIQNITSDEPIMTERRHCQRFKRTGVSPDFRWIFNNEDAILGDDIDSNFKANIPVSVIPMNVEYFDDNSTIPTDVEWYDDNWRNFVNEKLNDRLWLYAFIVNPEGEEQLKGTSLFKDKPLDSLDVGYRVLVAPLQEMKVERYFGNTGGLPNAFITKEWSAEKLLKAINSDKLNPRAISLRVSPIAPFNTRQRFNFLTGGLVPEAEFRPLLGVGGNVVDIVLRMNTLSNNTHTDYYFLTIVGSTQKWFVSPGIGSTSSEWCDDNEFALGINYYSLVQNVDQNFLLQTYSYSKSLPNIFTLPTNTTPKTKIREPKMSTSPFHRLEMSTGYSPVKELNELYFTESELKIEVNDIPTIADQKYSYSIAKSVDNMFYNQNRLLNNGLVGNNLYEFPLQKDRFAEYVSQHSNYLLSGLALPMAESAVSTIANASVGNVGGAVRSGVSGLSGALSFGLQLQDLQRTPDTIKSTGNNILHDIASNNDLKLKISTYVLWTKQQDSVFDYFYERGYRIMRESVWRKANDSSFPTGYNAYDALFNRSRFNYIKLNDDELLRKLLNFNTPLMPKARDMIVEVLTRGVRMIESSATASTTIANFNTTTENMEYNTTLT